MLKEDLSAPRCHRATLLCVYASLSPGARAGRHLAEASSVMAPLFMRVWTTGQAML